MTNWKLLAALGAVSIAAGILALLNPFPASLAVEQLAAWAFLIIGAVQIFEAYSADTWGGKLWTLLLGVVAVFVGINLLKEPLSGLVTLTLVLGSMFMVSGMFRIIVGLRVHKTNLKAVVLISGVVSLILGLIIISNFQAFAATILGILLGIELIFGGISTVALGLARKAGGVAHEA